MIRVFIVASTPTLRAGLRAILTTEGLQIVGEASVPERFVADRGDIDVIVVADEELLEGLERAVGANRSAALVILSNNNYRPSNNHRLVAILNTLSPHGWGVVPSDASAAQLQAAVVAAARGLITLPATLVEQVLGQRRGLEMVDIDAPAPDEPLTVREREVLEELSRGLPNKLIARRLQISEHTVKFHVSSIYAKLGATSRTDAVSRGVRRGLITL